MLQARLNDTTPVLRGAVGLLLGSLMLLSTAAQAQLAQVADWKRTLPGAVGVALARASFEDYVTLGIESPSSIDARYGAVMTLQRYTSSGQPAWSQPLRIASTVAGFKPSTILIDPDDNILVLATEGDLNSTVCALNDPNCTPKPPTLFDGWWLIQKYSPNGLLLWQRRQAQAGVVPVRGAFDASGDLYVAFDPNSPIRAAIVQRLSATTGATQWTALTPDGARPGAIALSSSGTVLLAAASSTLGLSINEFAPDSGARLTRTLYAAAAGYYPPAMAVGSQGEIAFTGNSPAGLFLGLETASRQSKFALSTTPGAQGRRVALDALGDLTVAGVVPASSGTNWLLLRYNALGAPLHPPVIIDRHASATEEPLDLVVADEGTAYITGAAGPGTATDPSATRPVTVRLAPNGSIDWLASESAGARGVGAELALDGSVAVLTAGDMTLAHYPVQVAATPTALTLSTGSVRGGTRIKGTVTLSTDTGAAIRVTSSNPAVASVPTTLNAPSGVKTLSFDIQTYKVKVDTLVTITATANGKSATATLRVLR